MKTDEEFENVLMEIAILKSEVGKERNTKEELEQKIIQLKNQHSIALSVANDEIKQTQKLLKESMAITADLVIENNKLTDLLEAFKKIEQGAGLAYDAHKAKKELKNKIVAAIEEILS